MGAVKIQKFFAEAPKISPELLPDTVAQFAANVKTYSGDLLPYNRSSLATALAKSGTIKTIFPMDDGAGGVKWLHWNEDVDVARAPIPNDTTQRIYYTGQSEPRITNYTLATTGAGGQYPISYYTLGLPTPTAAAVATATGFSTKTTVSRTRDSGNIARVVTSTPHGLNTGAYVTITGFTDTTYNLSNVQVTVVDSTTFSYYSTGSATTGYQVKTASRARASNVATIVTSTQHGLITGSVVDITGVGGTGYNATGVTVTVTNSTTFTYANAGTNETTATDSGGTITHPGSIVDDTAGKVDIAGTTQSRTYVYTWYTTWGEESTPSPVTNTVYVKEGQTVEITGLPSAWPGAYTGNYQTTGMKVRIYRTVSSSSGSLYMKCGEVDLGTTTFMDNLDVTSLATALATKDYDQPSDQMRGLVAIHNGMMIGFFGNTLCFCEPGQPHAWPIKYRIQLDSNIVALGNFGTSIIVATEERPWLIQGTHPATMAKLRMDYILPCVSKRSLVNMGYGVVYATRGGLAVYSSQTGGTFLTKFVHDWDTWRDTVDASSIVAKFYNGKYFASHANGAFMFERDDQVGGYLVTINQKFSAGYYDMTESKYYYVDGSNIFLWDDPAQLYDSFDWKSKVIVTKDYMNLGAARVIADYESNGNDIAIANQNNLILTNNQALANDTPFRAGGGIGGTTAGRNRVAGSLMKPLIDTGTSGSIQFQLFADKELIFTAQLTDSGVFRLPTGYRSDTVEVRVTGNRRVRAIHLGETPLGLKNA